MLTNKRNSQKADCYVNSANIYVIIARSINFKIINFFAS